MNGVGEREREREREREKTRETSLDRANQVCVLLLDNQFYTLSQNVFKVQDAYS